MIISIVSYIVFLLVVLPIWIYLFARPLRNIEKDSKLRLSFFISGVILLTLINNWFFSQFAQPPAFITVANLVLIIFLGMLLYFLIMNFDKGSKAVTGLLSLNGLIVMVLIIWIDSYWYHLGNWPVFTLIQGLAIGYIGLSLLFPFLAAISLLRNRVKQSLSDNARIKTHYVKLAVIALSLAILMNIVNVLLLESRPDINMLFSLIVTLAVLALVYSLAAKNEFYLMHRFFTLIEQPILATSENQVFIQQFITMVEKVSQGLAKNFHRKLRFRLGEKSNRDTVILHLSAKKGSEFSNIDLKREIPRKWVEGLMDSLIRLDTDYTKMTLSLLRAEEIIKEKWLTKALQGKGKQDLLDYQMSISLRNYEQAIWDNIKENREIFGVDILCFSGELYRVLQNVKTYAKSHLSVLFEGESGVGKSLMAEAMHNLRGGKKMDSVSCLSNSLEELKLAIYRFCQMESSDVDGLLIKHIDNLGNEDFSILEPVLKDFLGKKFVYFTASRNFSTTPPMMPPTMLHRLNQVAIEIPSLRERSEDVFYQIIYFILLVGKNLNLQFTHVNNVLIEEAKVHIWEGNSRELLYSIHRSLVENSPPIIEKLNLKKHVDTGSLSELSPLEENERYVMINFLKKNNYNKNQTSRDLDITINTLNTKIQKYGIEVPKKQ